MPALSPATLARIRRDNPSFDRDNAMTQSLARDCAIAYLWNPYVDEHEFAYVGWSTTLYAGVDAATRTTYVVFRGTDQAIDWLVNFACVPLPLAHPLGHAGFVIAWKLAKRRLMPWLRAQRERTDRVIVGGHSLGGALALACAYELNDDGFDIERCITVGAPRVYTRWSAHKVEAALGQRLIRVCREQDLVPKVPPAFLGFRHVGAEWSFVSEVLGEREPAPFPSTGKWLTRVWSLLEGKPIGEFLQRHGLPVDVPTNLIVLLLSAIAGLGTTATLIVQWSFATLVAVSMAFLVVSGGLVAFAAHRSGRYAAGHAAATLLEQWQTHHLREIAAGRELEPASPGHVWVDLSVEVRANHDDNHKRTLVRAFRLRFGDGAFTTPLGRTLDASLTRPRAGETEPPSDALDIEFRRACMLLLLYGYESSEIDAMLDTGRIDRPRRWTRFYARASLPPAA